MEQLVTTQVPYSDVLGIKLSKLMLGTAQMGMSGYGIANSTNAVNDRELLDRCCAYGINSFDTALEYGDAELKLGRYFAQQPEAPFIVSKVKTELNLDNDAALESQIRERVEMIVQRLQINRLPALMIHDPRVLSVYGSRVTDVLKRLRQEGLIGRAGLSLGAYPDQDYASCAQWLDDDVYEVIQLPMNIWDRRAVSCGAMDKFLEQGKIVIVRSVFLQGLFFHTGEGLPPIIQSSAPTELRKLRDIASEEQLSVAQLAISYVRDMEGVHCLVIGAERTEQLAENVELIQGPALSERARARIDTEFQSLPQELITPFLWK